MKNIVLIAAATGRDYMIAKELSKQKDVKLSVIIWADSSYIKKICNGEYHVTNILDVKKVVSIIKQIKPDYVIPGQGDVLQYGLADELNKIGILCIGPTKDLAEIEGSKTFMRKIMEKIDPELNPKHKDFFEFNNSVIDYINSFENDIVVKCDYVISGPRVRIFKRETELDKAISNAELWIKEHGHIIIEEYITGEEISLTTYSDGKSLLHAPLAKNYKRVLENDIGENTSGMGCISGYNCFAYLPNDIYSKLKSLNEKVLSVLNEINKSSNYIGSIYGEFIITKSGIKVIEYNCRFGNPCSLNIFSIMNYSIYELMDAISYKKINLLNNAFCNDVSVSAYVVPKGYTLNRDNVGKKVDFQNVDDEYFYYGNMDYKDKKYLLKNSRAFAICATGKDKSEAKKKVYLELEKVNGNIHYRKDIGGI